MIGPTSLEASLLPEKILNKGEASPHYGVLVPEIQYRAYKDAEIDAKALKECLELNKSNRPFNLSGPEKIQYGLYGLVLGILAASLLK